MKPQATIDQLQYLFTFPFKDEKLGTKFLIAFLLYFGSFIIPVIPWVFFLGYIAKIIGNTIKERELSLPEWDDWGDLAIKGLKVIGAVLIAEGIPLLFFGYGLLSIGLPAAIAPENNAVLFASLIFMGVSGSAIFLSIGILLMLTINFFVPPAISHMIAEDDFSAAFHISDWWKILKANLGGYIITYIILIGLVGILGFVYQLLVVSIILCWLIPFIPSAFAVYAGFVGAALFGQAYRVGKENLELEASLDTEA